MCVCTPGVYVLLLEVLCFHTQYYDIPSNTYHPTHVNTQHRPDRRPNVPLQPLGEYGGGLIWPFRTLTQDRDDPTQLHMYYSGTEGIHADIYSTKPMEDFVSAN